MIPKLVFVGGFLGAGKTTLILKAAQILQQRGQRVALIMNDQDSELVDTKYARQNQFQTSEVAGGCFCCRFSDLLHQAKDLLSYSPDVILAEPVGSCIDLSATILRPFQSFHSDLFITAPLTVLVDPALAHEVASGRAPSEIRYLFQQQIREADIVCTTKSDLSQTPCHLPFPVDFDLSARSGKNVATWLDDVLSGNRIAGARLLDVDYQHYAEAEAALGWLNLQASISLNTALSPAELVGPLLDHLDSRLTNAGIEIAHLKVFDNSVHGYVTASIRTNGAEPYPQGDLTAPPAIQHELAINLRAVGDAQRLKAITQQVLSEVEGSVTTKHCRAFQPQPPKPEHRLLGVP